jgi:hypothetical protein
LQETPPGDPWLDGLAGLPHWSCCAVRMLT